MKRRDFLSYSAGSSLLWLFSRSAFSQDDLKTEFSDSVLSLADGFSYKIISKTGKPMSDGYKTPGEPDGMACFKGPDDTIILMRNHELGPLDFSKSPYNRGQKAPDQAYEKSCFGAVTRLVINPKDLSIVKDNLVLVGTERNCAGGKSPWGWLSCEETLSTNHGYVFLCDPFADSVQNPRRISGYGRFNHEAATVDPQTLIAYLTEDRPDGCFYRFLPFDKNNPFAGQLQALKVRGEHKFDTSKQMQQGDEVGIEWVNVENADPKDDSVRFQAQSLGAAIVKRGEGLWLHGQQLYFTATTGGKTEKGQVFSLDISNDDGKLKVISESQQSLDLDMPDNLTVSPDGAVYIAEDGKGEQYIRLILPNGQTKNLAKNIHSNSEFAGVCFDPTGNILFANMQHDGITVAITGPFSSFAANS